jgi:hypothetical protein
MNMNPMQAIMGAFTPTNSMAGQSAHPMANGPFGALQGVMQRASQLAQTLQNPQQMIQQFFPNAPEEVRNDPDMLANWLQQSGMVSPQMVQMARQMCGR